MRKTKRKHRKSEMRIDRDAMMAEQGFLDVDTAAELLGVSTARAYFIGKKGSIVTRPLGGARYFSRASIEQYQRELTVPAGWLTLAEAMERSHWSRSTLYKRAADGAIKMRRLGGRVYVVTSIAALTR